MGQSPVSVNAKLSALNGLFRFLGWEECRARLLRLQRRAFREESKELTREEYQRLLSAAREGGRERLALLLETICATGIRVSEVRYITAFGEVFLTRGGASLSRKQIWREMKGLCQRAGVEPSKVFPHNLRHLFASAFYRATRDIVKLADVLGHASINTTRIYLLTAGTEHARQLERLGLVC